MTKKKHSNGNKRSNETAHQRAMTDPKVREAMATLGSNWKLLSQQELGAKLSELVELNCSVRGIAEASKIPASTIRRRIASVASLKSLSGRNTELVRTLGKISGMRSPKSAIEAARESNAMFQKNRPVAPEIEQKFPAKSSQHPRKLKPPESSVGTPSVATKVPVTAEGKLGGRKRRSDEELPKMSLVDQYRLGQLSGPEVRRVFASQPKLLERRPFRDISSMKRQGRPVPPTDPE